MNLESIKEEYKKEVVRRQVNNQLPLEELDQVFSEIDEASSLKEFFDMIMLSQEAIIVSSAITILNKIADLNEQ